MSINTLASWLQVPENSIITKKEGAADRFGKIRQATLCGIDRLAADRVLQLERPAANSQLDHEAVAVGGIAQVQHITIANINRRSGEDIHPESPDAIDRVAHPKSGVRRGRPSKHQAIVFVHELQAFCGKQNKTGAQVDLVGLRQIPRSARARVA